MSKFEGICREVIDKAEWVAIATSGAAGAHLAGTWGEYIRTLGVEDDGVLLIPVGGYRTTEQNLVSDNRVELLCAAERPDGQTKLLLACETSCEQYQALDLKVEPFAIDLAQILIGNGESLAILFGKPNGMAIDSFQNFRKRRFGDRLLMPSPRP